MESNIYLGKTKAGNMFERTSHGILLATTAYLHPIKAGYDFTVKMGKGVVPVQFLCINKGPRETIKFTGNSQYGKISNPNQTKTIRTISFLSFRYTPPNDMTKKGKTDRIVVVAERPNGEKFSQEVPILLM